MPGDRYMRHGQTVWPQMNAASHLGLFCLPIEKKNEENFKITPDAPKMTIGLPKMIMMGRSIHHIGVSHILTYCVQ